MDCVNILHTAEWLMHSLFLAQQVMCTVHCTLYTVQVLQAENAIFQVTVAGGDIQSISSLLPATRSEYPRKNTMIEIPWSSASGATDGVRLPCSSEMRCVNDRIVKPR